MASGAYTRHGHVQTATQPPVVSFAAAPEYNSLSDDKTATAAHYSGQPFGLLKDVTLSVFPFKAGFTYSLSRPRGNNAGDHYEDARGHFYALARDCEHLPSHVRSKKVHFPNKTISGKVRSLAKRIEKS